MRRGTDRQTHRHTDGHGQYTFRLGYASRENVVSTKKLSAKLSANRMNKLH